MGVWLQVRLATAPRSLLCFLELRLYFWLHYKGLGYYKMGWVILHRCVRIDANSIDRDIPPTHRQAFLSSLTTRQAKDLPAASLHSRRRPALEVWIWRAAR